MNDTVVKIENISDEKYNEMLSTGWRLMAVDNFRGNALIYSFVKLH